MEYILVFIKTLVFYGLITFLYRMMGKREVGELSIVDLIVSILIAEFAVMSIDNVNDNIMLAIIPMFVLAFIQLLVAKLSLKIGKVRNVFEGIPSVIIDRGTVNFQEMVKQRYNLDDLLSQLREKGIKSIEEVDYAILETSGKLSVFRKDNGKTGDYPLAIILDGVIHDDALNQIKKTRIWLKEMLVKEEVYLEDIFYGFYRNEQLYIIRKSELMKNNST